MDVAAVNYDPRYLAGIALFNRHDFFEAHEVWEDLWRETEDGPLRSLYQGLIQTAVGLHHLGSGNRVGWKSQLEKAIRNLEAGASAPSSLDISRLTAQLTEMLETNAITMRVVRIARTKP